MMDAVDSESQVNVIYCTQFASNTLSNFAIKMGAGQSRATPTELYPVYVSVRESDAVDFPPPIAERLYLPGTLTFAEMPTFISLAHFMVQQGYNPAWAVSSHVLPMHVPVTVGHRPNTGPGAANTSHAPTALTLPAVRVYGNPHTDVTVQSAAAVAGPGLVIGVTLAPVPA